MLGPFPLSRKRLWAVGAFPAVRPGWDGTVRSVTRRATTPGPGREGEGLIDTDPKFARPMEANTVVEGDRVRLKFLYPNGAMELLDCTWLATANLGSPDNPNGGWVVVTVDDRVMWKPLHHLIQLEVLEPNEVGRHLRRASEADLDNYHR